MDANQFVDFLSNSSLLAQQDYQDLKSLVLRYPYCANLHLLLLEKSVLEGHPDREKNLSRAAITCIDRNTLRLKMVEWESILEETGLSDEDVGTEAALPGLDSDSEDQTAAKPEKESEEVSQPTAPEGDRQPDSNLTEGLPSNGVKRFTPIRSTPIQPEEDSSFMEYDPTEMEDDLNFQEGKIVRRLAKQSLSENPVVASETLAELLVSQGNLEKAIQMYQQLSLKMPKKKKYFAAKIKELKS